MENIRYTMGLDIGIASVGWAVLQNDENGEPIKIENLGVRVFRAAELPKSEPIGGGKTTTSLARVRREKRGARRVIRRRHHRKERIRFLIEQNGLATADEMEDLFANGGFERSVYELRVDALDRLLNKEEAVRVLIHLAQRRGFQSNSKSEEAKDKENGKLKGAISKNIANMDECGYRTVGEMYLRDERFYRLNADGSKTFAVHNRAGEYITSVTRAMLREEIEKIFDAQRTFGASWASREFEARYLEIWGSQRNFDEGPGGSSPYHTWQVGPCSFEKEELRAYKQCYTTEYFRMLQTINNIKIKELGGEPVPLTAEQRQAVMDKARQSENMTYGDLRKLLRVDDHQFFNSLSYGRGKAKEEVEKKAKLGFLRFWHELRKALKPLKPNAIDELTGEQIDRIAEILATYKADDNRREHLRELQLPESYIERIIVLNASQTSYLSLKAMKKLIPYLEQGLTYDKACQTVYGDHYGNNADSEKSSRLSLSMCEEITNPVVRRAVSQSIKVVNAIVRKYGPPEVVRVELAREMGKTQKERKDIQNAQKKNQEKNEAAYTEILKYKSDPNGQDIVKYKLWQEQDGRCMYTGEAIPEERLFEQGFAEVDHIIPYSRSFDDSYANKVLVLTAENRQKGNRTPYEYFGQDAHRWEAFEIRVQAWIRNDKKQENFLKKEWNEAQANEYMERNMVDTQYLSRMVRDLLRDHMIFAETGKYQRSRVQSVKGVITAEVRKRLGLTKVREDGDLHHAQDAVVVACITQGMTTKITLYAKAREYARTRGGYIDYETGEILSRADYDSRMEKEFPEPWPHFRDELLARMSDYPAERLAALRLKTYAPEENVQPIFVSRMPNRGIRGEAHKETIYSAKKPDHFVEKTKLTKLKLNEDGEIANYYNANSDRLLYNALKERLTAFGGNAEKAFAECFHKPKADGTEGPIVHKVKVYSWTSSSVLISHGGAANGDMIRVDVYRKSNGYYYVPVYAVDAAKQELPKLAAVAHKPRNQWLPMDDKDFLFSIYHDDLIRIVFRNTQNLVNRNNEEDVITAKEGFFYFCSFNTNSCTLCIRTHDSKYEKGSLGGMNLVLLEKYEVDPLGEYHAVHYPQKREGFR